MKKKQRPIDNKKRIKINIFLFLEYLDGIGTDFVKLEYTTQLHNVSVEWKILGETDNWWVKLICSESIISISRFMLSRDGYNMDVLNKEILKQLHNVSVEWKILGSTDNWRVYFQRLIFLVVSIRAYNTLNNSFILENIPLPLELKWHQFFWVTLYQV